MRELTSEFLQFREEENRKYANLGSVPAKKPRRWFMGEDLKTWRVELGQEYFGMFFTWWDIRYSHRSGWAIDTTAATVRDDGSLVPGSLIPWNEGAVKFYDLYPCNYHVLKIQEADNLAAQKTIISSVTRDSPPLRSLFQIPVVVSKYVPRGTAWLISGTVVIGE